MGSRLFFVVRTNTAPAKGLSLPIKIVPESLDADRETALENQCTLPL
jgi:hypothetical protein